MHTYFTLSVVFLLGMSLLVSCGDAVPEDELVQQVYDDMIAVVHETVTDPIRARELFTQHKKIYRLTSQYDSQPEEVYTVLKKNDEIRKNWSEEIIQARFRIKDCMTREEWDSVFSP
jgi:hypothetical protein